MTASSSGKSGLHYAREYGYLRGFGCGVIIEHYRSIFLVSCKSCCESEFKSSDEQTVVKKIYFLSLFTINNLKFRGDLKIIQIVMTSFTSFPVIHGTNLHLPFDKIVPQCSNNQVLGKKLISQLMQNPLQRPLSLNEVIHMHRHMKKRQPLKDE